MVNLAASVWLLFVVIGVGIAAFSIITSWISDINLRARKRRTPPP